MATYSTTSPYRNTPAAAGGYLSTMVNRPVPKQADDQLMTIIDTYQYRPDLLAFDLYGDSNLWWVFAQRNPNLLQNPLMDFKTGLRIFVPKLSTLQTVLGI